LLKESSLRKLCLVLLLFLLILPIPVASQITVDFIDVGQGDAILIHSDEIAILIDGVLKIWVERRLFLIFSLWIFGA